MKRALIALMFAACAHTTTTSSQEKPKAEPDQAAQQKAPAAGEKSGGAQSRLERKPKSPGEPLVTSSPVGLLEKGSAAKIQDALSEHGFAVQHTGVLDDQTGEALRKFQKSQDIASHGMPDELTLARLGLDPGKIYRSNAKGDKEKNAKREEEKK